MVRKIRTNTSNNLEKGKKEHFEKVYASVLKSTKKGEKKHSKEKLKSIYTSIDNVESNKFLYLSYAYMLAGVARVESYLKEDVAFNKHIMKLFNTFYVSGNEYMKKVFENSDKNAYNNGVLESTASSFSEWAKDKLKNGYKEVYKTIYFDDNHKFELKDITKYTSVIEATTNIREFLEYKKTTKYKKRKKPFKFLYEDVYDKMIQLHLVSTENKEDHFIHLREMDYDFIYDSTIVIQLCSLLLKSIEGPEELKDEFKKIVFSYQTLVDFLYFKEIIPGLSKEDVRKSFFNDNMYRRVI